MSVSYTHLDVYKRQQLHLPFVPVEQQDVIFLFQLGNLIRDCRLRDVQRLCRAREPALNGNMVEGAKLDIAHGKAFGRNFQVSVFLMIAYKRTISQIYQDMTEPRQT